MDFGTSVHILSRKDSNAEELAIMSVLQKPTKDVSANDEVQTNEEVTMYVKDMALFVIVQRF